MNTKNFLAVALGAVTHFFMGFLLYGILLMEFFKANTIQYEGLMVDSSGSIVGYAISSIAFALLITYILGSAKVKSARRGLITGTIVTLLIGLSINLMFYFQMNLFTLNAVIADLAAYTIMGGATGWVVGYMFSRSKEPATAEATA